jgi:hypothetical protein
MTQYENSGPGIAPAAVQDTSADIRALREQITAQGTAIQDLQKELRRVKSKLDQHAVHLNKMSRG